MSRASRGISMIWVIFAVAVAGGAAITAFLQYLEAQSYKEWIDETKKATLEWEKRRKFEVFSESIKPLARLAGWSLEQEGDTESTIALVKDRVDAKKTAYNLPGKQMAMWEIVHYAELKMDIAKNRRDTAAQAKANADSNKAMSAEVLTNYGRMKDQEISNLDEVLRAVTRIQTDDVARYELRKTTLEAEDRKLVDAKGALEKQIKDANLNLDNEKNRIETQLKELVKQEAVFHDLTESQGHIVDPDQSEKYAFITLGERDRLVRGLKFMVFVREAGGNVRWKGQVEVKEVYPTSAKVSLVETVDYLDPIIEGDMIFNPLYSPTRPKRVALAGDFTKQRYTEEVAKARIRAMGSIVDEKVTDNTDFVIVGESYHSVKNYEDANLLSVPWRPAFEIFEFLGD